MSAPNDLAPYVRSFFEDHLTCRRNVSRNTIRSYRDGLKLLLKFAAGRLKKSPARLQVTDITETVIIDFLTDLERTRANSIQTRNHRLVGIRNLFEYIATCEPRLLEHCQRILAIPRKRGAVLPEIHYLDKDQITALLNAVPRNSRLGPRDYALLLFMYNTGARAQEVADARINWLTLRPPYKVEPLGKHGPAPAQVARPAAPPSHGERLPLRQPLRAATESVRHCRHRKPLREESRCHDAKPAGAKGLAAHDPAYHRHAPAAVGRGSQCDPQLAGARQHRHDQSLHRNRSGDQRKGPENLRTR
jgi:site-specific recombinase XerC